MANIPEPRLDHRRVGALAVLVAAVSLLIGVAWAIALDLGPIDDAYISLRYAANWAAGQGLSFNPGERVEGYTNFLWVVLEALAIRAGVDAESVLRFGGWAAYALLAFVQAIGIARLPASRRPILAAVAGVVLALHPMLICWAASGMETTLFAVLVLAAFLVVTIGERADWPIWGGTLLALAGLCRPEAVALLPAGLIVAHWRRQGSRQVLRLAAWFLLPYGIYFVARWWYFGFLLPNTFYAKLDYGGQAFWLRGWLYVWDFARAAPLVTLMAAVGAVIGWQQMWVRAWVLVIASQIAIVVYEGGDHFAMFRFLVAVLPFMGMLALIVPVEILERRADGSGAGARLVWRRLAVVGCLGVIAISSLRLGRQEKRHELAGVRQLARFRSECGMARDWAHMGLWLRTEADRDASLATIAVGAIGFYSELRIVDPLGLTDPTIAHRESEIGSGYAGHEKYDIDYIFDLEPEYLLLANLSTNRPIPAGELVRWTWGAFNRGALASPRLRRDYSYRPTEIAPGRWMNIHVRRQ